MKSLRCRVGIHRYTIIISRVGFQCGRCGHIDKPAATEVSR